jgi:hypothetical protein
MAAAHLAVLPLAHRSFLKRANMLCSGRDFHGIWFPEGEGIDWST